MHRFLPEPNVSCFSQRLFDDFHFSGDNTCIPHVRASFCVQGVRQIRKLQRNLGHSAILHCIEKLFLEFKHLRILRNEETQAIKLPCLWHNTNARVHMRMIPRDECSPRGLLPQIIFQPPTWNSSHYRHYTIPKLKSSLSSKFCILFVPQLVPSSHKFKICVP
jgi:hypothetical protein